VLKAVKGSGAGNRACHCGRRDGGREGGREGGRVEREGITNKHAGVFLCGIVVCRRFSEMLDNLCSDSFYVGPVAIKRKPHAVNIFFSSLTFTLTFT